MQPQSRKRPREEEIERVIALRRQDNKRQELFRRLSNYSSPLDKRLIVKQLIAHLEHTIKRELDIKAEGWSIEVNYSLSLIKNLQFVNQYSHLSRV